MKRCRFCKCIVADDGIPVCSECVISHWEELTPKEKAIWGDLNSYGPDEPFS